MKKYTLAEIMLEIMENMGMLDAEPYLSGRRNYQLEKEIMKNLGMNGFRNIWIKIFNPLVRTKKRGLF